MKKLSLLVMPLMVIPLLASCNNGGGGGGGDDKHYYTVTFDADGGEPTPAAQTIEEGKEAEEPDNPPEKDDYNFDGWHEVIEGEMSDTQFDFDTAITHDTTLKATWSEIKDSYHFTFDGTDCKVNGINHYEIELPAGTSTQFAIIPDSTDYLLPTEDEFEIKQGGKSVSYSPESGIIFINEIANDVVVTASSTEKTGYSFTFTGRNCSVNGQGKIPDVPYVVEDIKEGSSRKFTVLPDEGYLVPSLEKKEISIKGNNVTYENGVIPLSNMTRKVEVNAKAPSEGVSYVVSFYCGSCKASTVDDITYAENDLIVRRDDKESSLTLYLFPDDTYSLPDEISVVFGDHELQDGDYIYNKNNKTIVINKKDDVIIRLDKENHVITFNAGEGTFPSGAKEIQTVVKDGLVLAPYISSIVEPTLDDHVFSHYTYEDGSTIGDDDIVDKNIKIVAHYI